MRAFATKLNFDFIADKTKMCTRKRKEIGEKNKNGGFSILPHGLQSPKINEMAARQNMYLLKIANVHENR